MNALLAAVLLVQAVPTYDPYATLGDNVTFLHEGRILALAFFPDGKQVVSAVDRGTLTVWDVATGAPVASAKPAFRVASLAVSPDGKRIAAGTTTGSVVFLDWPGLAPGRTVASPGAESVRVSANASRAVARNRDKLDVFDLAAGKVSSIPHGHGAARVEVAISPDGETAATADTTGAVRTWKTVGPKAGAAFKIAVDLAGPTLRFSGDGKQVVLKSNSIPASAFDAARGTPGATWPGFYSMLETADHTVQIGLGGESLATFDPKTGAEIARYDREHPDALIEPAVSADGKKVAVVFGSSAFRVFSVPDLGEAAPVRGPGGAVTDVAFARKSDRLAAVARDGTVHVWDIAAKKPITKFDARFPSSPHIVSASFIRWSSDGGSIDGIWGPYFARWKVASGARSPVVEAGVGGSFRALSPDGESAVVAADGTFRRTLPAAGNKPAAAFAGRWNVSESPEFSPDGTKIALRVDDGSIALLEASSGRTVRKLAVPSKRTDRLLVSSGGEKLVVLGDALVVHSAKDGKALQTIDLSAVRKARENAQAYALSPDGAILAASFEKNEVHLWHLEQGKLLQTLEGPRLLVQSLAFSPDGRFLAGAGWDRAVHVWARKAT